MKNLLFFFFLIYSTSVLCQKTNDYSVFAKGKIITKKDTISCYIVYDEGYSSIIYYKLSNTDRKILRANISEIQSMTVGTDQYHKIVHKGNKYLMKELCHGKISLYEYKRSSNRIRFIKDPSYDNNDNTEDKKLITTSDIDISSDLKKPKLYIIQDDTVIKVKKSKIKKQLKQLMNDQKGFHQKIDDLEPRSFLFNSEFKSFICNYNFWFKKNS
ncbi:hypothetical protein [Aquimarina litoralis]|uniref:hypothetical protein n=1 Tax=Aquimarina litoralis TaxID=584605 RepID=UPI001C597BDF|nr:hypothetical protein [Aquimarina litoralis]MBW1299045.1 hypothetical protein [Aquimarina litoralis]